MELKSISSLNEIEKELLEKAREAQSLAHAPYSKFKVGVSVLMKNNQILLGANQENAAYPMCLCGEQVALAHAKMSFPKESILKMFITTSFISEDDTPPSPCGSCRQVISEYQSRQAEPIELLLEGHKGIFIFPSVDEILPYSFNGSFLN